MGGLRVLAAALVVVYLGWNAYWLSRGQLAPSLLVGVAGIPAPTTGMTRGIAALLDGDVRASLAHNAFAVPTAALFLITLGWLAVLALQRERLALPSALLRTWLWLLAVAWIWKLPTGAI